MSEIDQLIELMPHYRNDPIGFMTTFLDVKEEHVWQGMREMCDAVVNHQRVCVKAGHSVSKSYTVARIVLWFLLTRYPKCTVVTTADSAQHVEGVLWRNIRASYDAAKCNIGGKMTLTQLDLRPDWFAIGFATKPDTVTQQATRVHGWHN